MNRKCNICGQVKVLNETNFPYHPGCKGDLRPECRGCYNKVRRERYATNDTIRQERLGHNRKWRIGVSKEQFDLQKIKQNNCCAICGVKTDELGADHCHTTQIFRGLLCSNCNTGLGLFKDNVNNLQKAIIYLTVAKERDHNGIKNSNLET